MKKLLLIVLIVLFALTSIACSNNDSISNSLLKDRDALMERIKPLDNYIGVENSKGGSDYKKVLLDFMENHLKKEVVTFETINSNENNRSIVVTNKDGSIFKVILNNNKGIWFVVAYTELIFSS